MGHGSLSFWLVSVSSWGKGEPQRDGKSSEWPLIAVSLLQPPWPQAAAAYLNPLILHQGKGVLSTSTSSSQYELTSSLYPKVHPSSHPLCTKAIITCRAKKECRVTCWALESDCSWLPTGLFSPAWYWLCNAFSFTHSTLGFLIPQLLLPVH